MSTLLEKANYISKIKNDIKVAIEEKGQNVSSDFDSFAPAIQKIKTGSECKAGICLDTLGYTPDNPGIYELNQRIKYSEQIAKDWYKFDPVHDFSWPWNSHDLYFMPKIDTSKLTRANNMFRNCASLITIPELDTSNITNMVWMFEGCTSLLAIPPMDTSNVTDMTGMFEGCYNLRTIPQLDTSKATDMNTMFSGCGGLRRIPELDTSNATNLALMCNSGGILRIDGISVKSIKSADKVFGGMYNVRYALIKDIGYNPNIELYDFTDMREWARPWDSPDPSVDLTGAKQSLVDSLLKYSFDRRAAGYSYCTLKLGWKTRNELTKNQVFDIEYKGYIITDDHP